MKFDSDQIELAMTELGSVLLRLQRAGLTESQARTAVQRVVEMDELPTSCDEKMWDEGEPKGDESADAVKSSEGNSAVRESEDDSPDTERDPATERDPKPWHSDEDSPDTVRESAEPLGWDRFMDQILLSEGRKASARDTDLPDSPGMLHAKRYGEKAHNRIVVRK